MLRPSYAELMDVLNKEGEGNNVKSRYTVVIAAAKRARQIVDGHEPMIDESQIKVDKPMSIAVEEIYHGKIEVVPEGEGTVLNLKKPEPEVQEEKAKEISEDNDFSDDIDDDFSDNTDEDIEADAEAFESLIGSILSAEEAENEE